MAILRLAFNIKLSSAKTHEFNLCACFQPQIKL